MALRPILGVHKMLTAQANKARLMKAAGLAGMLLLGAMVSAQASTVVFSEDFSGATTGSYNTGSSGGTGVIAGTQFKVTADDVDLIGPPPSYGCVANPSGNCLDLIGGSGHGTIVSTVGVDLHAGDTYTIAYTDLLQGFTAGSTPSLSYTVALGSHSFNATSIPTTTLMSFMFTAAADEAGALLTFNTTSNVDGVHGPVISDITVSEAAVSATPLPAALPLFASGLAALGLVGRRRKRRAA